jgi:plastocyanin
VTITQTLTADASTWTTTYASTSGSAAPAPSAQPTPAVHVVTVGENGGLTYNPPSIKAAAGDIVSFQFRSKNHTITQSSFDNPCRKLEFTSTSGQVGFDSGLLVALSWILFQVLTTVIFSLAVAADASAFPTFNITVNETAPIWAYCRQGSHCGNGMVFAINAVEGGNKSYAAFQALAKQLNGTGSGGTAPSSSAAPTSTGTPGSSVNGASQLVVAGSWVGAVSALFMMFLWVSVGINAVHMMF